MAPKFPLKMPDGTEVRSLDKLREHFDLETVLLEYYSSEHLYVWLKTRGYEEAERVKALNPSSPSFKKELCEALGTPYPEGENISLSAIKEKAGRLERLKRVTVKDEILARVDQVAFTQEELENLLRTHSARVGKSYTTSSSVGKSYTTSSNDDANIIYLCGETFTIPGDANGISFIGLNNPEIKLTGDTLGAGISFKDVCFDTDGFLTGADRTQRFFRTFDKNRESGVEFLQISEKKGSTIAKAVLGECYMEGFGVKKDDTEATKCLQSAAEQGDPQAQSRLGECYMEGFGVKKDATEATKWLKSAAEQGDPQAQSRLGECYMEGFGVEKDATEAIKWLKSAAEKGEPQAQFRLGMIELDPAKAVMWYKKAANQGQAMAQYHLGCCYRNGNGVERDPKAAIEWLQKACDQGVKPAREALIEVDPRRFTLSEVILYAIGGEKNLHSSIQAKMDRANGTIDVPVQDRHKIIEAVLRAVLHKFGADKVQIEKFRTSYKKKKNLPKKIAKKVVSGVGAAAAAGFAPLRVPMYVASKAGKDVFKVVKDYMDDPKETVYKDTGSGCVHILMDITTDMEDDFNRNLLGHSESEA